MKTAKQRLTAARVKAAAPRTDRFVIWDNELRGFGLRVMPSGEKSYVLKYSLRGRQRWFTIESANAITPDQARDLAESARGQIARGEDPAEAKKAEKHRGATIGDLLDAYIEALDAGRILNRAGRPKSQTTITSDKSRIAAHIRPLLGKRFVRELTSGDIEAFLHDVAEGKAARDQKTAKKRGRSIVTGGKGAATRCVGLLGGILSWGNRQGYGSANPVLGVKRFKDNRSERYLSPSEIKAIGQALQSMENNGADPYAIAAERLLLLTGCRMSEILTCRWTYIDFEHSCLRLPSSKTDAKIVPLGAAAVALLKRLDRLEGNPFVIPGHRPGHHFVGLRKVHLRVLRKARIPHARVHDLRHSFGAVSAAAGKSLYMIGKILGHADPRTTARYAHLAPDPLKEAADSISRTIDAGLKGKRGAKVVRLPARA
jgi:integrase